MQLPRLVRYKGPPPAVQISNHFSVTYGTVIVVIVSKRAVFQLHTRTRKNRPSAARSRVSVALYEVRCVNLNPSLLIKRRSIFTNAYNSRVLFCSLPFTVVVKCTKPSMLRLLLPIFGSIHIMGYVSVPIQKSWRWPRNKR